MKTGAFRNVTISCFLSTVSWSHRAVSILRRLLSQKHDGPYRKWSLQAAPIWQKWRGHGPGCAAGLTEDVGHQDSVNPLVIFQRFCCMRRPVQGMFPGDLPVLLLRWLHTNLQISPGMFLAEPRSCLYCLSCSWQSKCSSRELLLRNKGHVTGLQIRVHPDPEVEGRGAATLASSESPPAAVGHPLPRASAQWVDWGLKVIQVPGWQLENFTVLTLNSIIFITH